jgi:hypothetical protein
MAAQLFPKEFFFFSNAQENYAASTVILFWCSKQQGIASPKQPTSSTKVGHQQGIQLGFMAVLARGFGSLGVWTFLVQCSRQTVVFIIDQSTC